MLIEDAKPEDWPALERIYREARLAVFEWMPRERIEAGSLLRDTEGESVYVARARDGSPVGFVSVWAPENFVHHLYVAPALRRGGAGSALLDFAARRHPGILRLKCAVRNYSALAFYQRLGWREIGEGTSEDGDYFLLESAGAQEGSVRMS